MKTLAFQACLAGVIVLVAGAGTGRADWQVWTEARTVHVLRGEPAGKSPAVAVFAARGETRSFQVLVRSDAPVGRVTLQAGDLRGPGGAVLRADDAELYRQHQFYLDIGTYRNKAFQADWYPDALIPFRHPVTHAPLTGARISAVPFDLPAGQTHGFWVDLSVPAGAAAGEYRGTYRLTAEGGKAAEIPVCLTVWDFALPAVSALKTSFGSPAGRMRSYYRKLAKAGQEKEPADWAAVEAQCADLLSRHRIAATPPPGTIAPVAQADGTYAIPPAQVEALRRFVDRYHVNAVDVPAAQHVVKDPQAERTKLHAWLAAWDKAAKDLDRGDVLFYMYLYDEPNDLKAYRFVQQWGKAVREAHSVVKVMVVEQTLTQDAAWGDLYGAVDIWCPLFCLHDEPTAERRRALGETVWTYTALCQGKDMTPWWHIDYPLLHYRVPAWTAWRYDMTGLLYWGGLSYWDQVTDPWNDPKTYDMRKDGKGLLYNGEGSLVYPGRAVGYDGIASSLRLKALRDSIQDYEYLAMLARMGQAKAARDVVMGLTPSWTKWDQDPAAYDQARAKLAEMIVGAEKRK